MYNCLHVFVLVKYTLILLIQGHFVFQVYWGVYTPHIHHTFTTYSHIYIYTHYSLYFVYFKVWIWECPELKTLFSWFLSLSCYVQVNSGELRRLRKLHNPPDLPDLPYLPDLPDLPDLPETSKLGNRRRPFLESNYSFTSLQVKKKHKTQQLCNVNRPIFH